MSIITCYHLTPSHTPSHLLSQKGSILGHTEAGYLPCLGLRPLGGGPRSQEIPYLVQVPDQFGVISGIRSTSTIRLFGVFPPSTSHKVVREIPQKWHTGSDVPRSEVVRSTRWVRSLRSMVRGLDLSITGIDTIDTISHYS